MHAVCGNRDIYTLRHLPVQVNLTFAGFKVGMVHGHGRLHNYLADKAHFLVFGLQEDRFRKRVIKALPGVDVMVFGHLHRRIYEWVEGVLLLNPGSACCPDGHAGNPPSVAVLHLQPECQPVVQFFDQGLSLIELKLLPYQDAELLPEGVQCSAFPRKRPKESL